MSKRLFPEDVLFFQRLLKADGLYQGELDGLWGPLTEAATQAFDERTRALQAEFGSFDPRSERNIATLALRAQREARRFFRRVLDTGIRVRIISGTRTYAEQSALYQQGRFGNPGPIVTKAKAGFSNHNFGIAWDIGIFTAEGDYVTEEGPYRIAAQHGLVPTLEWGGDWHGFVNPPHYQLKIDVPLEDLRVAFETGHAQRVFALQHNGPVSTEGHQA